MTVRTAGRRKLYIIALLLAAGVVLFVGLCLLVRARPGGSAVQAIAAVNAAYALPPQENAATIYDRLIANNVSTGHPSSTLRSRTFGGLETFTKGSPSPNRRGARLDRSRRRESQPLARNATFDRERHDEPPVVGPRPARGDTLPLRHRPRAGATKRGISEIAAIP